MADQIRVNNNMHSWGSIILKIGASRFVGFTSISYGDKRERVYAYGMQRAHGPRGRSRGKYTPEPIKIAGPKGSAEALRALLRAQAIDGVSIGDVEFEIAVQYIETGEIPIHDTLTRCVLVGVTSSHEESPDPLKDELELSCMAVIRNGTTLFDATGVL